jgi:hypothetical protein
MMVPRAEAATPRPLSGAQFPPVDTSPRPGIRKGVRQTAEPKGEDLANHLTPTELAREAGMERREVIAKCMELGVPIFQGRIDKTLFLASLKEGQSPPPQAAKA